MENNDSNRPKGQRQRDHLLHGGKGSVHSTIYKLFFHWVVVVHPFDPNTLLSEVGNL